MPATLIDRDRYRKPVRERVFPFVRGFATWWLPAGDERGLLVIDVPAHASKDKPFVVSGSDGTQAAVDASAVAVPLQCGAPGPDSSEDTCRGQAWDR